MQFRRIKCDAGKKTKGEREREGAEIKKNKQARRRGILIFPAIVLLRWMPDIVLIIGGSKLAFKRHIHQPSRISRKKLRETEQQPSTAQLLLSFPPLPVGLPGYGRCEANLDPVMKRQSSVDGRRSTCPVKNPAHFGIICISPFLSLLSLSLSRRIYVVRVLETTTEPQSYGSTFRSKGGALAAVGIFFDSPPLRILILPAHEEERRWRGMCGRSFSRRSSDH